MHWDTPTDPLFKPGGPNAGGVEQRGFADCWYAASLISVAEVNPDFIREGIRENPNGTVSVRIWDEEGDHRWVTVSADLPHNDAGEVAGTYGDGETWAAYYEKAFALAYGEDGGGAPDGKQGDPRYDRAERGTYGALEWDWTRNAAPYLTGNNSTEVGSFDDVTEAFRDGQPVLVSSESSAADVPADWGSSYSTRHVYYVRDVDDDGNLVLGNPWGPRFDPITVTPEQYDRYFSGGEAMELP
jgi:hypothetical protein